MYTNKEVFAGFRRGTRSTPTKKLYFLAAIASTVAASYVVTNVQQSSSSISSNVPGTSDGCSNSCDVDVYRDGNFQPLSAGVSCGAGVTDNIQAQHENYNIRYRINCDNGGWQPAFTLVAASEPSFDTSPTISKVGTNDLLISWQPANDGGSPTLGHQVHSSTDLDSSHVLTCDFSSDPTRHSCLAQDLAYATEYTFHVTAINRVGSSAVASTVPYTLGLRSASNRTTINSFESTISSNQNSKIRLDSVDQLSGEADTAALKTYIMSVCFGTCTLDDTNSIIVRDVAFSSTPPYCCPGSSYANGKYEIDYQLELAGPYKSFNWSAEQGGLLGQYWDNQWFTGSPLVSRQDSTVDFDWGNSVIVGKAADYIAVRWTGFLEVPYYDEQFTFSVQADDGSRLWVNGVMLFDSWDTAGTQSGLYPLQTNTQWPNCIADVNVKCFASIRLEYREQTGSAKVKLSWESRSRTHEVVPAVNLYSAVPISGGVQAITVDVGIRSKDTSYPYGDSLEQVVAGQPASFNLQARDAAGNNLNSVDDVFSVTFTCISTGCGAQPLAVTSIPVANGQYIVHFTLDTVGEYTVRINLLGAGDLDHYTQTLVVVPGNAAASQSQATFPQTDGFFAIAGQETSFDLDVRDANNNEYDVTDLSGQLRVQFIWQDHAETQADITLLDVKDLLTPLYGQYFEPSSVAAVDGQIGQYEGKITLTREGPYQVVVTYLGEPFANSPYTVTARAATIAYGPNSLLEHGGPPTAMTAGTPVTLNLQPNDNFGNLVTLGGDAGQQFTIQLGPAPYDEGTCTIVTANNRYYACTINPQTAGNRELMVRVDGLDVRKTIDDASGKSMMQGPFPVTVSPGPAHHQYTSVLDLSQTTFIAGKENQKIIVQLRDEQNNNLLEGCDSCLEVKVGQTVMHMTDLTTGQYEVDVGVGGGLHGQTDAEKHNIGITVFVNAVPNSPFITVVSGPASALTHTGTSSATVCNEPGQVGAAPTNSIAGAPTAFVCTPKDAYENHVDDSELDFQFELMNVATNEIVSTIPQAGSFSSSQTAQGEVTAAFDMSITLPTAGMYSASLFVKAKGGLKATYYRTAGFLQAVEGATDRKHNGQTREVYTRIDPQLDFTWQDIAPVNSMTTDHWTAKWEGYILPKVSGTHVIRLASNYGCELTLGETVMISQLGTGQDVSESVELLMTAGVPVKIIVKKAHNSGVSFVRLYWSTTHYAEELVPSENLLYELNAYPDDRSVEVKPADAGKDSKLYVAGCEVTSGGGARPDACAETCTGSDSSTCIFNDYPLVFTAGSASNAIFFQTYDDFGNQRSEDALYMANDVVTDNLVGAVNDVSTTAFTYTYRGDDNANTGTGAYDVLLPVTKTGNYELTVTAGGNAVVGSPFSIVVQPGPPSAPDADIPGGGKDAAVAGVQNSFTVTLRDANHNLIGATGSYEIEGNSNAIDCVDDGNDVGVFICTYTLTQVGIQAIIMTQKDGATVTTITTLNIAVTPRPVEPGLDGATYTFDLGSSWPTQAISVNTATNVQLQQTDQYNNPITDDPTILLACEAAGRQTLSDGLPGTNGLMAVYSPLAVTPGSNGLYTLNLEFASA
eukprot:gene786-327_t